MRRPRGGRASALSQAVKPRNPPQVEHFAKAPVQRGRPKSAAPKVSATLRLDPDVLDSFRATGPGWQSRINAALRKAAGLA